MNSPSGLPAQHKDREQPLTSPVRLEEVPLISEPAEWTTKILKVVERRLPAFLKPKGLFSFKNRILFSTVLLMMSAVVVVGIALQIMVFPDLESDSQAIRNIKAIHLLAGLMVIVVGWLFIEFVSKKVALPLIDLTRRADQISREAGAGLSTGSRTMEEDLQGVREAQGNEILQLTLSFNRMLAHLKASEARLKESEEKYRFLFDSGPSPIFVMDAETLQILDVNARAEEEYQYSKEELLVMTFADLGLDTHREETLKGFQQLFEGDITFLPVLKHHRKDGSIFMVNYQAGLSRYMDRPAVIAAVWDVTERLEKYAQLIQAGKMATLGEMATGIAHELNQPLNVLKLSCDYIMKKIRGGHEISTDELSQITKECNAGVDRASTIINHLRQFGRKAEETMSPIDINEPIRNVFNLVGRQLEAKGIRWKLILTDNLPKILGDANRLEQVMINLVLNARDAILSAAAPYLSEPKIEIASSLKDERIVVTVTDTGPGIPEYARTKVFEPFFTTKKPGEGTGLGLSISYGIIKEHRGAIEIDSMADRGATFILTFPAMESEAKND